MFVFTSVMVTATPGSTRPDESLTLPTSDPLTACAAAAIGQASASATTDTHTAARRVPRRTMSHPPYERRLQTTRDAVRPYGLAVDCAGSSRIRILRKATSSP